MSHFRPRRQLHSFTKSYSTTNSLIYNQLNKAISSSIMWNRKSQLIVKSEPFCSIQPNRHAIMSMPINPNTNKSIHLNLANITKKERRHQVFRRFSNNSSNHLFCLSFRFIWWFFIRFFLNKWSKKKEDICWANKIAIKKCLFSFFICYI